MAFIHVGDMYLDVSKIVAVQDIIDMSAIGMPYMFCVLFDHGWHRFEYDNMRATKEDRQKIINAIENNS